VKGREKTFHANENGKKVGVAIVKSDKIAFQVKNQDKGIL